MKTFLKKPKRLGWRVSGNTRERLVAEEPKRHRRGSGYLLAPCVVLWAAAHGTREAYHAAMSVLPWARSYDFKNL